MTDIQKLIDSIQAGTATDEDVALVCGWSNPQAYVWQNVRRMISQDAPPQFLTGPEWDLSPIVAELPEGMRVDYVYTVVAIDTGEMGYKVHIFTGLGAFVEGAGPTPKAAATIAMLRARDVGDR